MNKLIRFFAMVISTLIIHASTTAQTTYEDVVYLKNGSIIHGMIIEQVPNQSIKIQTRDHNVFVYKMDEVEKITKESVANTNGTGSTGARDGKFKGRGYMNITELNFGVGTGTASEDLSFGLQTVNGYLFSPFFSLGLGIGVDKYKNATFLPIFIDMRGYFIDKPVTPFVAVGIGYALAFQTGSQGGLMFNPSIGVRIAAVPKAAFDLSVGYRLQQSNYTFTYYSYYGSSVYYGTLKEDLVNVKFGVSF